jgi:hypothetical protein
MPTSILWVMLIELMLIVLTLVLLIQPTRFFKPNAMKLRKTANWVGLVLLCLTFCWSVVVGIVLTMNGFTLFNV